MYKKNDGKGINYIQNRFSAFLKMSLHNNRINYLKKQCRKTDNEVPIEKYEYYLSEDDTFARSLIDCEIIKKALNEISERERKIFLGHLLDEKDFEELGKVYGLSYKGAAAVFYRTLKKLRNTIGGYEK